MPNNPFRVDFQDTDELAAVYDDLPLWSAPFALALLETVRLTHVQRVLDVGCGTGFPLIELAERLGPGVQAIGIDPWAKALDRARIKIRERGVPQVSLVTGTAESMPFESRSFDLLISNNGINNVEDRSAALGECYRVCRVGGQFVFTVNLPDTMKELYQLLVHILRERGYADAQAGIDRHVAQRRQPVASWSRELARAGFSVASAKESEFHLRFANGCALFNHWFIRLAFLGPWLEIVNAAERESVFNELERRLDQVALEQGGIRLSVPFVCIDARK